MARWIQGREVPEEEVVVEVMDEEEGEDNHVVGAVLGHAEPSPKKEIHTAGDDCGAHHGGVEGAGPGDSRESAHEAVPDLAAVGLPRQDEPGQRQILERMPGVEALEGDIQIVEERNDEGKADGRRYEDQARPARLSTPDLARGADDVIEEEYREAGRERLRNPDVLQELGEEQR